MSQGLAPSLSTCSTSGGRGPAVGGQTSVPSVSRGGCASSGPARRPSLARLPHMLYLFVLSDSGRGFCCCRYCFFAAFVVVSSLLIDHLDSLFGNVFPSSSSSLKNPVPESPIAPFQ